MRRRVVDELNCWNKARRRAYRVVVVRYRSVDIATAADYRETRNPEGATTPPGYNLKRCLRRTSA